MRFVLSTATTLAVASVALGQEFPDPNPVPQADGTNLWYVGNNTQYPVIQDVLDAVSDGDEVVVRGGLYVESLHIDNNEITMRPFVSTSSSANGTYEHVTFLNPTEGFNNDNGYAMKLEGGRGTYIGIPRQFTELSNGLDVQTRSFLAILTPMPPVAIRRTSSVLSILTARLLSSDPGASMMWQFGQTLAKAPSRVLTSLPSRAWAAESWPLVPSTRPCLSM